MEVPINLVALIVAGVVNMLIGFAWYSPMLFGNQWMKLSKIKPSDMAKGQKEMPKFFGIGFAAAVVTAFVLKHMSYYAGEFYGESGLFLGTTTGFYLWLGMIMPVQLTHWMYEKQPFQLFLLHTGYQLTAMLAMGAILAMWG